MSKLTRSKIAYDLTISPHRYSITYGENQHVRYIFSSRLYMSKFMERLTSNRIQYSLQLSKRVGVDVNFDILADLKLYKSIEKRGYLLNVNGEDVTCPDQIILDGVKKMSKS